MDLVFHFLSISLPEDFLLTISSLFWIGKYDKIDFKNKSGILRIVIATFVNSIIIFSVRTFVNFELPITRTFLMMIIHILVYMLVFKINWFQSFVGIFISVIGLVVFESIVFLISNSFGFDISYQEMLKNQDYVWNMMLFSLPVRVFQIINIILIKRYNIKIVIPDKINFIKPIFEIAFKLIATLFLIAVSAKNFLMDSTQGITMVFTLVVIVGLILSILIILDTKKKVKYIELYTKKDISSNNNIHCIKALVENILSRDLIEESDGNIDVMDLTIRQELNDILEIIEQSINEEKGGM